MIPKIIHYCWFGRNPLPESAINCINSWKKFFPDYEIKEWNVVVDTMRERDYKLDLIRAIACLMGNHVYLLLKKGSSQVSQAFHTP